MKKCPYCAEEIQDEAIICRFCHQELKPGVLTKNNQKRLPAIFWGVLVGLLIAILSITRRGETISAALDLLKYPPLDQMGSAVIGGIVVGSFINLIVWTLLTTLIIFIIRKAFNVLSEVQVLIYAVVAIVIVILSMTYFYSVMGLSQSVVQANENSMNPIFTASVDTEFVQPMPTNIDDKKPDNTVTTEGEKRNYVLITSTPRPNFKLYFPSPMPGAREISSNNFSQGTADNLGEFFGVTTVRDYRMYTVKMNSKMPTFTEFLNYYKDEMANQDFDLEKVGGNYLIFTSKTKKVHIGIIYDEKTKSYRLAQW